MSTALEVTNAYYAAWGSGDFDGLRQILADDFTAHGPLRDFDDPDSFVAACRQMGASLDGIRLDMVDRMVVDGGDGQVVHAYAFKRGDKEAPVAELFTVKDGKIAGLRIFQDPARFGALLQG